MGPANQGRSPPPHLKGFGGREHPEIPVTFLGHIRSRLLLFSWKEFTSREGTTSVTFRLCIPLAQLGSNTGVAGGR